MTCKLQQLLNILSFQVSFFSLIIFPSDYQVKENTLENLIRAGNNSSARLSTPSDTLWLPFGSGCRELVDLSESFRAKSFIQTSCAHTKRSLLKASEVILLEAFCCFFFLITWSVKCTHTEDVSHFYMNLGQYII